MKSTSIRAELHDSFMRIVSGLQATEQSQAEALERASALLVETVIEGNSVLACGNGGSAADAQHMVAELVSSFRRGLMRRSLPAVALTSNTSTLTAYANDFNFEYVFARQVSGLGRPGDCLIAITTSGNSLNVLRAAEAARAKGLSVIALQGPEKTKLSDVASVSVHAQGDDTQTIQAIHLAIEHLLCYAVEEAVIQHDQRSHE